MGCMRKNVSGRSNITTHTENCKTRKFTTSRLPLPVIQFERCWYKKNARSHMFVFCVFSTVYIYLFRCMVENLHMFENLHICK